MATKKEIMKKYSRTKKGVATVMLASQKRNCKDRGHTLPTHTKKEFTEWLFGQKDFHDLFDAWEISGYKKDLKPSIDRKDDYIGYVFSNMQVTTWQVNNRKGHDDRVNGKTNKLNTAVIQMNEHGVQVSEYHSICEAERRTNICKSNIARSCKGQRKTAGGFAWKYK